MVFFCFSLADLFFWYVWLSLKPLRLGLARSTDDSFSFPRAADQDVDDADNRPTTGDSKANIRFLYGVGVTGNVQIDDAAQHDDVGDAAKDRYDGVLYKTAPGPLCKSHDRPEAGKTVEHEGAEV